jgi:hypothetical protein
MYLEIKFLWNKIDIRHFIDKKLFLDGSKELTLIYLDITFCESRLNIFTWVRVMVEVWSPV